MSNSARIFVSYARRDGKSFARELRVRLQFEHNFSLTQDLIALEGGKDWWNQLAEAIKGVEHFVLVLTKGAVESAVVRDEWQLARREGVCVVPVLGTPRPDISTLPLWMQRLHIVDPDLEEQWTRMVRTLESPCHAVRVPNMTPPLPEGYVDRPQEHAALRGYLLEGEVGGAVGVTTALRGVGGFGKTTIAQALCKDVQIQNAYYDGILWITLGQSPGALNAKVEDLIQTLTGHRPGFANLEASVARLAEELADRSVLIVVDDVWQSDHLEPFLRFGKRSACIVTTRINSVLPANSRSVAVDAMAESESVALLCQGLDAPPNEAIQRLAKKLSYWPLLLKLANGVLRDRVRVAGQSIEDALAYIQAALGRRGLSAFDKRAEADRRRATADTIDISLGLLEEDERQRLIELAVFPEDIAIPLGTITRLWGETDSYTDFDTEELCTRLFSLSLLQVFDLDRREAQLHDVIRSYLHTRAPEHVMAMHHLLLSCWDPRESPREYVDEYYWRYVAYHYTATGRSAELAGLLTDFDWVSAKLMKTGITALSADYASVEPSPEITSLRQALQLAAHVLSLRPEELPAQLLGRLAHTTNPILDSMLDEVRATRAEPWLEPLALTLTLPGGPLIQTFKGHVSSVNALAIDDAGTRLVSGSSDGTLRIWELDNTTEMQSVALQLGAINAIAWLPDSSGVVAASRTGSLAIWQLEEPQARVFSISSSSINALAITKNGEQIYCGCADGVVVVFDSSLCVVRSETLAHPGGQGNINALALADEDATLLSGASDGALKKWRIGSELEHLSTGKHNGWVLSLLYEAKGRTVLSGSDDGIMCRWRLAPLTEVDRYRIPGGGVHSSGWMAADPSFLTGGEDGVLRVWDGESGMQTAYIAGHDTEVLDIATHDDVTISADAYGAIKRWDLRLQQDFSRSPRHPDTVVHVAVTPDGTRAASVSGDGTLKAWDASSGQEIDAWQTLFQELGAVSLDPRGDRVFLAVDNKLETYELDTDDRDPAVFELDTQISTLAVTADGGMLFGGGVDGTVTLWNTGNTTLCKQHPLHKTSINGLALSKDGRWIAISAADGKLCIADTEQLDEPVLRSFAVGMVRAVNKTPAGWEVVGITGYGAIGVTRLCPGSEPDAVVVGNDSLSCLAVSSGGTRALVANTDGGIALWNVEEDRRIVEFTTDSRILTGTLSADEHMVLAGDRIGRLHFLRVHCAD